MSTSTAPTPVRPTARRGVPGWRGVLRLLHIGVSVGWLGVTATFVVLTVWLLGERDPLVLRDGYAVHALMVTWLARPAAILAVSTGLLLVVSRARSWTSRWWVWWVPAKLGLLVATVVVTAVVSPPTLGFAVDGAALVGTPVYDDAQRTLVLLAVYHVVMISAAATLAVFRPGRRFRVSARAGRATEVAA